jgi:hypothetical protein
MTHEYAMIMRRDPRIREEERRRRLNLAYTILLQTMGKVQQQQISQEGETASQGEAEADDCPESS